MGALRNALDTIRKYLGQLTGRDQLLIGSLAAVVIMALVLVATLSSKATMVELLPDMGPEANAEARRGLDEAGIPYTAVNGKVMVKPDQRQMAIATLGQAGKLPANAATLFTNLLKSQNWMASKAQSDQLANAALCEFVGGVIGNFKGVERASVVIDAPEPVGMGLAVRRPTASVGVLMKPGKALDKEMVDAVAALVAGSKAGLDMTAVKVIDLRNNRQYTARPQDDFSGDYMELVSKIENKIEQKVREAIAYDRYAIVAVTAQVDNTKRRVSTEKFMPKGQGSVSLAIESNTKEKEDSTGTIKDAAGSGLQSNVTADIARDTAAAGTNTRNTDKTEDQKYRVGLGSEREEIVDPRGMPTKISVMISLSREYMAYLVKLRKPAPAAGATADAASEPTQQEIDAAFVAEKARLEKELTPLVKAAATENPAAAAQGVEDPRVVVSMSPVPQGLALVGGSMAQAGMLTLGTPNAGGGGGGVMSQFMSPEMLKPIFMGLLAVVALGMMMMLVRKSSRPQKLPTAEEIVGLPPVMEMKDTVVGEADESQQAMVGIELGDNEMKVKKMVEQVQEMVKKNPTDAIGLIKRWMTPEN